ncbi:toprim domain-containing protein, partial [Xenorhabdus bovienii]
EQIRFCEKQPTYKGDYQAMWALATDSRGQLCYLHRTYLDGDRKAPLDVTKKMMSLQEDSYLAHAESVAIRMFPVASTLGIAEGIETALSCKQIYGVNTWSTMNAGHMAKFLAPRGVKHLIIFADNDWSATGEAAAYACATKNLKASNDIERVSVRWPDLGDFNDLLQNGDQAREREFMKKQRETA